MKSPKRKPLGRPKRSDQHCPTNETIIIHAARLFMEYGYEPVSLNQIAQGCEVTKASLYYHFANKAELFTESLVWILSRARSDTEKALKDAPDIRNGLERLAVAKMSAHHIDFESLMKDASPHLSEEQLLRIRQAEHGIHDVLSAHFRAAMDSGQLRQANPLLLSHALTALLMLGNRPSLIKSAQAAHSTPELAKMLIDLFWDGVAPER
ncbi:TetR/AcrR family transcriptional regulator [Paenibacillus xylaniclasticus]|uniref:TetR/AcrR family transcriptional regulator n=1 Tax=Paenibacillus xylaniclasticus TaxID=588083 RepID=UPI000FD82842|nr:MULTISPECIES: TetR/AcrR family transcriptional regulator [Paenibacillus]GFN33333.1 TetR family transcriptional regulator [Paenibacillus curdlanolyticus]